MKKEFLKLAAASLLAAGLTSPAFAVLVTWDNSSTDGKWGTLTNWSNDALPTSSDDVVFDNTNVAGSYTVALDGATAGSVKTIKIGYAGNVNTIILAVSSTAAAPTLAIAGDLATTDDFVIDQGGRFENTKASGAAITTMASPNLTFRCKSGGYLLHNSAGSYGTPWSAAGTTWDSGSTIEFAQSAGTAVTLSGRTYANIVLSATSAKIDTASGGSATAINGDLTIGPNVTFNPSMGSTFTIAGNIISNGSGGAITTSLAGGPTFIGNTTLSGAGTPLTWTNGLTVNSASTLTIGTGAAASVVVPSAKTLQVNGTLNCNGNPISGTGGIVAVASTGTLGIQHAGGIDGQITTTGANNFANGTYVYNGSVAQVTGASLPINVSALTINNAAGVTLSGNVAAVALTLTSGELAAGANALIGTTVTRTSGFVTGTLTRTVDATIAGARVFDVGTAGKYTPLTVDITGAGAGNGTISVSSAAAQSVSEPAGVTGVNRVWTISQSALSGFTASLIFKYDDADMDGGLNEANLAAFRYNGVTWDPYVGSNSPAANTVTATGVMAFSPWEVWDATTAVAGWKQITD
ncbi:hypothetical protein BH09SUM1_BH09SUM1_27800 [soil metagenome]